ncbi:MAG: histidine kinase [Acidobacteriota bacterium]
MTAATGSLAAVGVDLAMPPRPSRGLERRRWRWGLYWGAWTLVACLFTMPLLAQAVAGAPVAWSLVVSELLRWYLWGLVAPLGWWLARRAPIDRGRLVSSVTINVLGGLGITLLYTVLDLLKREAVTAAFTALATGDAAWGGFEWPRLVYWGLEYHLLTYFCIVAVIHAFLFYDKLRERELKSSRLEAQLALAHLEVLKMQLHPHFLFNTLNAVSALMHRDVDAADKMIAKLSDLLRVSLVKDDRHLVPLRDELDLLDRYLAIEKIRFRDRLRVEIDVDPECLDAQVPRLILQPLVENAIKHGISMRSAAGLVAIHGRRRGDRITLAVADDGPGLAFGQPPKREGVGLANTKERLEQLYENEHRFALERAEAGGLEVQLEFPFETTPRLGSATP